MGKKHQRDPNCNCLHCRSFRRAGRKGRAPNCLTPKIEIDFGGSNNQEAPSAGEVSPSIGGSAVPAVSAGGGQAFITFGRPSARPPPTRTTIDAGSVAAITAGGGQVLGRMFQQGATFSGPLPRPRAPPPPRPPREGVDQGAGHGPVERPASAPEATRASAMEAATAPNPMQDRMEVTPESPPLSPSGAGAAAGPAAPPAEFGFSRWGPNGMVEGNAPPSRTPQGYPGPTGGGGVVPVTAEAVARLANRLDRVEILEPSILDDMYEYVFESSEESYAEKSIKPHVMVSPSDDREGNYSMAGDAKKEKRPRRNRGKVYYTMVPMQWSQNDRFEVFCSVFNFPSDEPVNPTDEGEGDVEEEEPTDVYDQEAEQDEMMGVVDDGYNGDNEGKGGG